MSDRAFNLAKSIVGNWESSPSRQLSAFDETVPNARKKWQVDQRKAYAALGFGAGGYGSYLAWRAYHNPEPWRQSFGITSQGQTGKRGLVSRAARWIRRAR